MDKMMKAMKKCVEEYVEQLSVKYKFDKAEALEYIMPAGETVRGRPTKQKKKVVNKTEMVEDVIKTLMEEGGNPLSNPALNAEAVAVTAPAVAEPVAEVKADAPVTETVAVVEAAPVKEKKKPAPKKKKAEALVTEAVVVEAAVVKVVAQAEPVIVTSESGVTAYTVEEGEKTAKAVAALMEATKEDAKQKKKAAPKKKKAEAEAVVAQAEPVTVAAEGGLKGDAPLVEEAPKEKKKAAPKKKKAEAEVAVAAPAVTETVAEVKADAPVTEPAAVVEAAPVKEKKKAAPKKKKAEAEVAARKVAAGKQEEVVEAPKPVVVEAPKPAPETKAAAPSGGVKGVSPLAVSSLEEDDDEGTAVKEWTHNSRSYLKSCENNCEEDDCNCSGVVYDAETQDQIGTWNGKTLAMSSTEDDEEADD